MISNCKDKLQGESIYKILAKIGQKEHIDKRSKKGKNINKNSKFIKRHTNHRLKVLSAWDQGKQSAVMLYWKPYQEPQLKKVELEVIVSIFSKKEI